MEKEKTICVVTGTRAEYGLLKPLLFRINKTSGMKLKLVVTGMHLCSEFGYTWKEIVNDGIPIDEKLEVLLASDTKAGMTKSTALAILSFADYFNRKRPDVFIVLGDRFETYAGAVAAAFANIPIAHIYGGDTTEGAADEFLRHSITKMACLHFPSNEQSRMRIIQLGEHPDRVINAGALSVENILNADMISKEELESRIGMKLEGSYGLVTYHPVTLDDKGRAEHEVMELVNALGRFPEMCFIITKSNADAQGRLINSMLDKYVAGRSNCVLVDSLGMQAYLSAMKEASVVIGNSSSGLYEAPYLRVPTVNIGNRQRGRAQADSVLNCEPIESEIASAIKKALSPEWKNRAIKMTNPYGEGTTSEIIVNEIKKHMHADSIDLMKEFYNISVKEQK